MHFEDFDLRNDATAAAYVKQETVTVVFAEAPGELQSREGPNRYERGDALVTGSNGDVWSVTRDRFDARYEPVSCSGANASAGPGGTTSSGTAYRNRPLPVLARQITEKFTMRRRAAGDLLNGKAGDWLIQYAPGDYGIVDQAKFARLYRRYSLGA